MRNAYRIILKKWKERQIEKQTETNKENDLTMERINKAKVMHVILNN